MKINFLPGEDYTLPLNAKEAVEFLNGNIENYPLEDCVTTCMYISVAIGDDLIKPINTYVEYPQMRWIKKRFVELLESEGPGYQTKAYLKKNFDLVSFYLTNP